MNKTLKNRLSFGLLAFAVFVAAVVGGFNLVPLLFEEHGIRFLDSDARLQSKNETASQPEMASQKKPVNRSRALPESLFVEEEKQGDLVDHKEVKAPEPVVDTESKPEREVELRVLAYEGTENSSDITPRRVLLTENDLTVPEGLGEEDAASDGETDATSSENPGRSDPGDEIVNPEGGSDALVEATVSVPGVGKAGVDSDTAATVQAPGVVDNPGSGAEAGVTVAQSVQVEARPAPQPAVTRQNGRVRIGARGGQSGNVSGLIGGVPGSFSTENVIIRGSAQGGVPAFGTTNPAIANGFGSAAIPNITTPVSGVPSTPGVPVVPASPTGGVPVISGAGVNASVPGTGINVNVTVP